MVTTNWAKTAQNSNKKILIVAGSDPTAGAGVQADLKTITALGGYAMTVITAITVQDTNKVYEVKPVSADLVAQQMAVCLADIGADAIKLGMLATAEIVEAVAEQLAAHPDIPVIADPVLAGTGGGELLDGLGRAKFMDLLLPHIDLITPNGPEAQTLTGLAVRNQQEQEQAARKLAQYGCGVLLTGGHLPEEKIVDLLLDKAGNLYPFVSQRLQGATFHGTGCTLASAIALHMARGIPLHEGVEYALAYLHKAMVGSLALGSGQRILQSTAESRLKQDI
ncbi:MAG: bifunctional hydroxymethylpyrimidine kinase/phosphomethylpyrimidine kinase [Magnetococcales bacterium]|nr:bifunctional hydroxymethylpyrimidine kinase/phosphomethylpyrimidine kinase [Magnetococcales bacterium]